MSRSGPALAFNAVVGLIGLLAVLSGLYVVGFGGGAIPGGDAVAPSVDSELRLLAVFWIGFGLVAIRAAPHAATETRTVRALALALFAGGAARVVSWVAVGRPAGGVVVLTALELAGPPALVLWQRVLAGDAGAAPKR